MIPTSILKMFGRSPIGPLQEHMQKAHTAAENLLPFFEAALVENWKKAEKIQLKITQLEHEADDLKRDIRLHLPKSMFMPIARSDILELLSSQDHVANKAKDIAGIILGRHIVFPKEIAGQISKLIKRSVDASTQATKAISELTDLFESGFRGKELKIVGDMIKKLDQIENETDTLARTARQSLFQIEKQLDPVEVMFLYKVIEWIGALADNAQHVGGRLHVLLAR